MLGKLIKHEFKSISQILGILHIALLFTTIMGIIAIHLSKYNNWEVLSQLTLVLYILILIAVSVSVLIYIVVRFYRNLFTDEGYLMNTLPVKSYELIISKLAVGFVWCMINGVCTIISILILTLSQTSLSSFHEFYNYLFKQLYEVSALQINRVMLLILVSCIISVSYMLNMLYASIAIGQISRKHKVLLSLGAFAVLYIISKIISTIVFLPFGFISLFYANSQNLETAFYPSILLSYAVSTVLIIIYFTITNYLLSKKLNLE